VHVVFLRGLNVGGHRTFRPAELAGRLRHLRAVNIGAAGTFVIRRSIGRAQLRAAVARRLPFESEIAICRGGDVARLLSRNPFKGLRPRADTVPFVSLLSRRPRSAPRLRLPVRLPSRRRWLVTVLGREGPFVVGLYRRRMQTIACLGRLDGLVGAPVVTRNWNTLRAVGLVLARRRVPRAKSARPGRREA
jgi:uncharacterized protein (DUF1697 family)